MFPLTTFCDVYQASNVEDKRSTGTYIVVLRSNTELEYRAMVIATTKLL